jgi:endonuclease/exonuclease/phosphatase family metal-dependent hydrolase
MEFSVMTYNIQLGLESNIETVAGIIGEADVVAVQEVGYDWIEGEKGSHPQMLSRASGLLHFRFASSMTVRPGTDPPEIVAAPTAEDRPGFGVALLSRFPLGPWTRHRLPKRRNGQRCILSATVVTPSGPVTVLVTHLSSQAEDRPSQVQALLRHAQTQATPLIVMGDMSASEPEESMAPMNAFLSNAGGDSPMPSFPADAPSIATDHIYVSKELKVVQPSMALPMMGSSHLPVMARLSL